MKPGANWAFDFARWTLADIVAYEESATLRERLPIMAKVVIETPYQVDLADRETWARINALEWKELQAHFAEALARTFRSAGG